VYSVQEIKVVLECLKWTTLFERKFVEQLYLTLQKSTKKIIGVVKQYFNIILMAFSLQIGANDKSDAFLIHDEFCGSTELFLLLVHPFI
jgi:hypothetical protein